MLSDWDQFFTAQVGASGALAGLVFVGLSLNMSRILKFSHLPDRALQALILLFTILILSSVALVPGQGLTNLGLEILGVGVAACGTTGLLGWRIYHELEPAYRRSNLFEIALVQAAMALYILGGIVLAFGGSYALLGLDLLVPGFIISFIVAMMDAWVLLVEINR